MDFLTIVVVIAICSYWIISSFVHYQMKKDVYKRCSCEVFGTIVDVEEKKDKKNINLKSWSSIRYYPTIQYVVDQKSYVQKSTVGSQSNHWKKGKPIRILYNPHHVEEIYIPNIENYQETTGLANVVISIIASTIIIIYILYFR